MLALTLALHIRTTYINIYHESNCSKLGRRFCKSLPSQARAKDGWTTLHRAVPTTNASPLKASPLTSA